MKPYFAKYLPVEGEIKERDQFHSISGELPGSQHERLFLCSRDIEFYDDNLFHADGSPITQDEKNRYGRNEILVWRSAGCYKVIGEISPDATWVKEGDEFNRNDFEMRWTNSKGENSLTRADVDRYSDEPILKAFIKGPCGHFH